MIQINTDSTYYIVFVPDTMDGIFSALTVKFAYDNNLYNENWQRNVQCYVCDYSEKYDDIKWFKDRITEFYNEAKQNDPNASLTVMFLNYFPNGDKVGLKLFNACAAYGFNPLWICNDIDLIENYRHLNIPGSQVITNDSGAMQVWNYIKDNDPEMKNMELPEIIKFAAAYDNGPTEDAQYSWEEQIMPFMCYLGSFDKTINDNTSPFMKFISSAMRSNDLLTKTVATVGKPIYSFIKNWLNPGIEHFYVKNSLEVHEEESPADAISNENDCKDCNGNNESCKDNCKEDCNEVAKNENS